MKHIALLGDSIFDNAAYVNGGPDVIRQLTAILPTDFKATLLDGRAKAILQSAGKPYRKRARLRSVQEVPALEQQIPPPDQQYTATQIEIDREGLGGAAERQQPKKERLGQHGGR